jgi:DNA topoisomerase IA
VSNTPFKHTLRTVLFLHVVCTKEQSPKNALAPSLTAFVVCKLLEQYFPDFVDTQFTARMEDALDQIATGAANKTDYLSQVCLYVTHTVIY